VPHVLVGGTAVFTVQAAVPLSSAGTTASEVIDRFRKVRLNQLELPINLPRFTNILQKVHI
jgi:hypothetical protein